MPITIHNLQFNYGGDSVVDIAEASIPDRSFTVIAGKNGSGKSTLLKILAGIERHARGGVAVDGVPLEKLSNTERARIIGYLPQHHSPIFPFTVEEFALTGRASFIFSNPSRKDIVKTRAALETVEIAHLHNRPYTELSGGEQQLVMIARIIAQDARIILLDEPVSHLDLPNSEKVFSLLKKLIKGGITVVAVIHDLTTSFRFGEHFIFLKNGKPAYQGGRDCSPEVLSSVYDIPIDALDYHGRRFFVPGSPD